MSSVCPSRNRWDHLKIKVKNLNSIPRTSVHLQSYEIIQLSEQKGPRGTRNPVGNKKIKIRIKIKIKIKKQISKEAKKQKSKKAKMQKCKNAKKK